MEEAKLDVKLKSFKVACARPRLLPSLLSPSPLLIQCAPFRHIPFTVASRHHLVGAPQVRLGDALVTQTAKGVKLKDIVASWAPKKGAEINRMDWRKSLRKVWPSRL